MYVNIVQLKIKVMTEAEKYLTWWVNNNTQTYDNDVDATIAVMDAYAEHQNKKLKSVIRELWEQYPFEIESFSSDTVITLNDTGLWDELETGRKVAWDGTVSGKEIHGGPDK